MTEIEDTSADRPEAASMTLKPKWVADVVVGRLGDEQEPEGFVLKHPAKPLYRVLSPEEHALWELIDGSRTVAELRDMAAERFPDDTPDVDRLLRRLADARLLAERGPFEPKGLARLARRVGRFAADTGKLDGLFRLVGRLGIERMIRSWWGELALAVVTVGLGVWGVIWFIGAFSGPDVPQLFSAGGSYVVGLLFLILMSLTVSALETAVLAVCLRAGQHEPVKAGIMLRWGVPTFFAHAGFVNFDSSRRWRVVLRSVPMGTDLVLAFFFTLLAKVPVPIFQTLMLQAALVAYLRLMMGLCPLAANWLVQILSDLVGRPDIRYETGKFLRRRVVEKIVGGQSWTRLEVGYFLYMVFCGVWLVYAAGLVLWMADLGLFYMPVGCYVGTQAFGMVVATLMLALVLFPAAITLGAILAGATVWCGSRIGRWKFWDDAFATAIVLIVASVIVAFLTLFLGSSAADYAVVMRSISLVLTVLLAALVVWQTDKTIGRGMRMPLLFVAAATLLSIAQWWLTGTPWVPLMAGLTLVVGGITAWAALRMLATFAEADSGTAWMVIGLAVSLLLVTNALHTVPRPDGLPPVWAAATLLVVVILVNGLMPAMFAGFRSGVPTRWLVAGALVALAVPLVVVVQLLLNGQIGTLLQTETIFQASYILACLLIASGMLLQLLVGWRGQLVLAPYPSRRGGTDADRLNWAFEYMIGSLLATTRRLFGKQQLDRMVDATNADAVEHGWPCRLTPEQVQFQDLPTTDSPTSTAGPWRAVLGRVVPDLRRMAGQRLVRRWLVGTAEQLPRDERLLATRYLLVDAPWAEVAMLDDIDTLAARETLLRPLPWFEHLSDEEFGALAAMTRTRTLRPDEELTVAGEPARYLFVVQSGHLQRHQPGRDEPAEILGPGQVVGHLAAEPDGHYTHTIRAADETTVLTLPREALQAFTATADKGVE